MRVSIPEFKSKSDLFTWLKANKSDLIGKKCSMPIKSDDYSYDYSVAVPAKETTKADTASIDGELPVSLIGNTALWCDSQMDVLLPDCWKKTIKESGPIGKDRIYHLKNHGNKTDDIIGKYTDIYSKMMAIKDLGYDAMGETQVLVFDSLVKRSLDPKSYQLYKDKTIKQHSIGLQYVKLDLCINDPSMTDEFALWNKYYSQVINKEVINRSGWFWIVSEIKLYECSAVLFGSNELTPTLEEKEIEPLKDTQKDQPIDVTDYIKSKKYFTV